MSDVALVRAMTWRLRTPRGLAAYRLWLAAKRRSLIERLLGNPVDEGMAEILAMIVYPYGARRA